MATGTTAEQIIDVVTPAAGESVTEGTILEWHVRVGDHVKADATIVEISTDKVDVELPAPASGTVTELLVSEGDTVTVGQVIARIAIGDAAAPAKGADAPSEDDASRPADAPPPAADANGSPARAQAANGGGAREPDAPVSPDEPASGRLVDVVTPAAGESVSEGTILEWRAKVGDPIKASDTIVEISTDKVDVELPAPASGTVAELLVAEGETVTVGQVIARIAVGEPEQAAAAPADGGDAETARAESAGSAATAPDDAKVSPVAARVAAVEGVDLSRVA